MADRSLLSPQGSFDWGPFQLSGSLQPLLVTGLGEQDRQFAHFQSDAPPCDNCGALTVRCGTCYRCFNCGNSMGCS